MVAFVAVVAATSFLSSPVSFLSPTVLSLVSLPWVWVDLTAALVVVGTVFLSLLLLTTVVFVDCGWVFSDFFSSAKTGVAETATVTNCATTGAPTTLLSCGSAGGAGVGLVMTVVGFGATALPFPAAFWSFIAFEVSCAAVTVGLVVVVVDFGADF